MAEKTLPGVTPKAAYHHGDLRAQLIAAATALVEAHGPDGFSVAQAARLAGVSTAAPYKHFKDRDAILRGVVGAAMDRLREAMEAGAAAQPQGSLEAVAATGEAYIAFARREPGLFRLTFGLTEGHEEDAELLDKGRRCFGVLVGCVAASTGLPPDAPEVLRRAYILWSFVHGHAFLTIDRKNKVASAEAGDWGYLMEIGRAVLGDQRAP